MLVCVLLSTPSFSDDKIPSFLAGGASIGNLGYLSADVVASKIFQAKPNDGPIIAPIAKASAGLGASSLSLGIADNTGDDCIAVALYAVGAKKYFDLQSRVNQSLLGYEFQLGQICGHDAASLGVSYLRDEETHRWHSYLSLGIGF